MGLPTLKKPLWKQRFKGVVFFYVKAGKNLSQSLSAAPYTKILRIAWDGNVIAAQPVLIRIIPNRQFNLESSALTKNTLNRDSSVMFFDHAFADGKA